jgi:hypothetical protein
MEDRNRIADAASNAGLENFITIDSNFPAGHGYNPKVHDGYAQIETKELHPGATGPHIHVELNRKASQKYASFAKEYLKMTPTSNTTKPTAVPSDAMTEDEADKKQFKPATTAPTAPVNASDIAKQKRTEYLNQLNKEHNEGKPPHQQFIIDNSDKRSSITNNGGGDSGGAVALGGPYDTALEWYFRQQLA